MVFSEKCPPFLTCEQRLVPRARPDRVPIFCQCFPQALAQINCARFAAFALFG